MGSHTLHLLVDFLTYISEIIIKVKAGTKLSSFEILPFFMARQLLL